MKLTSEQYNTLKGLNFVKSIEPITIKEDQKETRIFPNIKNWNGDWYGPLVVPQKGKTIEVNSETMASYGEIIRLYEGHSSVLVDVDKLIIDGNDVPSYTFQQDYYFMMGDNRHNSLDSRYWGFVPEDHVVGKAFFIWLSLDKNKGWFEGKIRWRRFLKMIN